MSDVKSGQTLQATALVLDANLRLLDVEHAQHWNRLAARGVTIMTAVYSVSISRIWRRVAIDN